MLTRHRPTVAANWTEHSSAVLGGGTGGQAGGVYHGNAFIEGSTIHPIYVPQASNKTMRRATAPISDPTSFTDQGVALAALSANPDMGNKHVLRIGSTYYILYEASIDNWQLGLATSTSITTASRAFWRPSDALAATGRLPQTPRNPAGPWIVLEDRQVIVYSHSGPAVSGSIPIEIYQARIPVANLATNGWTIDNIKQPNLFRSSADERDQLAGPAVFANPTTGERFIAWTGYDNSVPRAVVLCQRLLPSIRPGDPDRVGAAVADAGGRGVTSPQKPVNVVPTSDMTAPANTLTDVLSATFWPTGPASR